MTETGSPAPRPQPQPDLAPWREPVRGGYPDPGLLALPGIEQLRALLAGRFPKPPLSRLTGNCPIAVADGTTTFTMPLSRWLCSPQGPISIGPLAIPADAALATAIQTELPARTPYSTSELSLRLLAAATPGETIFATSEVIQVRRTIALSQVRLTDGQGRLVGHGSTLCFVQPSLAATASAPPPEPSEAGIARARGEAHPEPGSPDPDLPEPGSPDPYERPAAGEILAQEVFDRLSGLEVLHGQIAGELPQPPIHHLLGLRAVSAGDGEAAFALPTSEWLCAPPRNRAQGGCVALLAEAAMMGAVQTKLPAGVAFAPIDLKVNFLRPLVTDGRDAVAVGRVLHAGRRIAVARSEVRDADGRPVAMATGSAMVLPGRPASLAAAPG